MKAAILTCSVIIGLMAPCLAQSQTNATSVSNPVISVTPAKLDFGTVGVGKTEELTVNVQNLGGGTLSGQASSKAPFSIISGSNYVLAAQQLQTVTVRYSPTAGGSNYQAIAFTGGGGVSIGAVGQAIVPPTNLRIIKE